MADSVGWWEAALSSDQPVVTVREWSSGEHIVMNTAAMLELLPSGGSYAEWVDEHLTGWGRVESLDRFASRAAPNLKKIANTGFHL